MEIIHYLFLPIIQIIFPVFPGCHYHFCLLYFFTELSNSRLLMGEE
ncbi:hypothetical protein GY50_0118 [Dehalococcoides mccartyi GY50]|nr:hypothetical protein GY50_0118 [Dehalococcoides mccartyi GY50]